MLNGSKRWDSLSKKNILKISDEKRVKSKWKSSSGKLPVVADGLRYTFEIFTKSKVHRYSYSNPETLLQYYDLNNDELLNINAILDILNNEWNFRREEEPCP